MLNTIPLPPSNYLIKYYQTLNEVTWQEKLKDKCFGKNLKKIANFIKKFYKIRKVKLLKQNPLKITTMQWLFNRPWKKFSGTWESTNIKNWQKL